MNNGLKNVIIFMSGAAVGGLSTYFGIKKYFELKADLEIADVKKVFEDRLSELEDHRSSLDGDLTGPKEIESGENTVKSVTEILNNKPDIKDYTKYFNAKGEKISGVGEVLRDAHDEIAKEMARDGIDPAEMESPPEDEAYSDEEDRQQTIDVVDYELNGASKNAIAEDKDPYEIEASDYELTCSQYDKIALNYYISDDILVNDDLEIVDEGSERRLIGDMLVKSGFDSNEDDLIYIRNDKIMCDFEITKIFTVFGGE